MNSGRDLESFDLMRIHRLVSLKQSWLEQQHHLFEYADRKGLVLLVQLPRT